MTVNRDNANEVYTPVLNGRTVSAVESAPTTDTDGTACSGFNVLLFSRQLVTATSVQYTIWLYDGFKWNDIEVSTGLTTAEYDPTAANFLQRYILTGATRYSVVITATDGTVTIAENHVV